MLQHVYQHFRNEERPFIDLVNDWIMRVERDYTPFTTDFLNPRQAYIVKTLIGQQDDIKCAFFGGSDQSERVCAVLYPLYMKPCEKDYEISLIEVHFPKKFAVLSHGKILGSLLSTGIKREYIGDIITDGSRWQFWAKSQMESYLFNQVEKISSFSVRLEKIENDQQIDPIDEWLDETITISSLRIDNLVSTVYNISRQRAKELIEHKRVQLNWMIIERPDGMVSYLDIVSVRKFGRIQIGELFGKTKKDKHRLAVKVFRK